NTDVYDHGMIEKFILHYQSLLSCLLSDPIKSINDVHYLSKGETVQLLDDFNSVKIDIPTDKTMVDLFLDNVENHPNNLAVVFGETSLTYKELDEKSNRLAHYLISEKATNKGDFIGIHLDIGLDYMISLLGILKAGCAYVSIDTGYPSGRKRYLLDNSSIGVVITDTTYMFEIDFYEGELFAIDVELDSFQGDNFDINLSCPDDLAYVLYTSGSTGVPKGVMITHGNLLDYLSGLIASLGLDKGIYSYGLMSTPSADLGNTVLFGSLSTGGVLHLFSREMVMDVYSLISYFDTNPIDIIKMVPSHWYSLCSGDGIFLPDRSIIFGGEKLTNGVLDKIKESNSDVAVYNHYGPTETTVGKLIHKVDLDRDYTNIPIGKPFSNSGVYVLDSNMHLVPIGVVGELYIDGLGVSQGYLNNADLTTETFVSHPFNEGARMYKTGDLARWSEEGTIEFMGRADDQVKIRGHRVEVKEIESILNELDHISQSLVISQSDDSGSIRLIAYIVSDEAVLDIMGIDDALRGDLPDYMIPSVYEKLDAIPLTENGKVDYKALPKVTDGVVGPAREYVGPETDEEKALVAAWESVLKKERVSIKDNFYQLGGDS
ncbi:non-ribosomal peptide synthetase, partial [Aquimarina algiphila]|uniref:non-ribosomal peptide synthetase n=3 Tax=Aquimarina algiphila TaxID=2047982 RepID=UPI00249382D3